MNEIINDEDLVDSEDERDAQEEKKEQFELKLTLSSPLPHHIKTILVPSHGNGQALIRIILGDGQIGGDKLKELGKIEAHYKEKDTDVLKILHYSGAGNEGNIVVLMPEESLKSLFVNQLIDKVFG